MENILSRIAKFSQPSCSSKTEIRKSINNQHVTITLSPVESAKPSLLFVCFSKERPFQLHQMLTSLKQQCMLLAMDHQITVIYKEGRFSAEYSQIISLHSNVFFIAETDFADDLIACLSGNGNAIARHQFVCFCVDDLVFTGDSNVHIYCSTLNQDLGSQIFGFLLKMHLGICYSHAASRTSKPPRIFARRCARVMCQAPGLSHRPVAYLQFEMSASNRCDWLSYFDLCGGLYRTKDVMYLIQRAVSKEGKQSIANPNILEYTVNTLIANGEMNATSEYRYCAFPRAPCLTVVTINRVQTTYNVPIYDSSRGDLATLNSFCADPDPERWIFDFKKYASQCYLSVHIGDLYFKSETEGVSPTAVAAAFTEGRTLPPVDPVDVSIVLPIYNGERYLKQCLFSLLGQCQGCAFEVIIVDDGSTDRSVDICSDVLDMVDAGAFVENPAVRMKIVRLEEHVGLAAALDKGVAEATSDLVARLDSDDICEPGRLVRQVQFLRGNPGIHVVGGQALLVTNETMGSSSGILSREEQPGRIASTTTGTWEELEDSMYDIAGDLPTHPVLVQWYMMMFKCSVMHPTVMFRKAIVQALRYSDDIKIGGGGGGGEVAAAVVTDPPGTGNDIATERQKKNAVLAVMNANVVEDYSLWMRILLRYPRSIANLPDVVLQLRRHSSSKSAQEASYLVEQSRELRLAAAYSLIAGNSGLEKTPLTFLPPEAFHALSSPKTMIKSADIMLGAFEVLHSLHRCFLQQHEGYLNDAITALLVDSCREVRKRIFEAASACRSIGEQAAMAVVQTAAQRGFIDENDVSDLTVSGAAYADILKRVIADELGVLL